VWRNSWLTPTGKCIREDRSGTSALPLTNQPAMKQTFNQTTKSHFRETPIKLGGDLGDLEPGYQPPEEIQYPRPPHKPLQQCQAEVQQTRLPLKSIRWEDTIAAPSPMTSISNPEGEMLHQGCCLTSEHRMPSPQRTPSSITR
jgi:hypothetical protein